MRLTLLPGMWCWRRAVGFAGCCALSALAACSGHVAPRLNAELATNATEYVVSRTTYSRNQALGLVVQSTLRNTGSQTLFVRRRCDHDGVPAFRFERVGGTNPLGVFFLQECVFTGGGAPFRIAPGDSLRREIRVDAVLPLTWDEGAIAGLAGDYRLVFTVQATDDTAHPPPSLIPLEYRGSKPFRLTLQRPQ